MMEAELVRVALVVAGLVAFLVLAWKVSAALARRGVVAPSEIDRLMVPVKRDLAERREKAGRSAADTEIKPPDASSS